MTHFQQTFDRSNDAAFKSLAELLKYKYPTYETRSRQRPSRKYDWKIRTLSWLVIEMYLPQLHDYISVFDKGSFLTSPKNPMCPECNIAHPGGGEVYWQSE